MKTSTTNKQEALQFSQDSQQYLEAVKDIFVEFFNAQDEKNKQTSVFGKLSKKIGLESKPKISKTNLFLKFYNLILLGQTINLSQDLPEDIKQAVNYMQVLVQQARQMDALFIVTKNPLDNQVQKAVDGLQVLNKELIPQIAPVKEKYRAAHNKYKKLHQKQLNLVEETGSSTSANLVQKEQQLKALKELYENVQRENDELAVLLAEISEPKYDQIKALKQQKVDEAYQKYFNQLKEKSADLSEVFSQVQQNIKQLPLSPAFNGVAGKLQEKASEKNGKDVQRYSEKITQPLGKLKEEMKAHQNSTKKVEQFAQIAQQIYAAKFEKAQKIADKDFDIKLAEVDEFRTKINLIMFSQMEAIGKLEKEIKQERAKLETERLEAERQEQLRLEEQQKLNAEIQDQLVTDADHETDAPTSPRAQGESPVALDKLQVEASTVKESGHGQAIANSTEKLKQQLEKYLQDRDPSKAKGFKWISLSLQYNTSSLRQEKVKAVQACLKALDKNDSAEALEKLKAKHAELVSPKTNSRFCLFSKSEAKRKGELGTILEPVENNTSNAVTLKM